VSRLIGRAEELGALLGLLDVAEDRRGGWAAVTGEPGIGKTRLVAELCDVATRRGAVVLRGRGTELESDVPFGIVIDAFDDHLAALGESRLAELLGGHAGELSRLFPALSGQRRDGAPATDDRRYAAYRELRRLVERLAATGSVLLVLDDLHWADRASVDLVSFLLRHPPAGSVTLVLTWRPGQAPTLEQALHIASRDQPGIWLCLEGLAEDAVGELLGAGIGSARLASICRESGGNPFYAQALAQRAAGGRASGGLASRSSGDAPVPAAVVRAIGHEVASLGSDARLLAAAVVGDPFETDLAARCAELGPDDAERALDDLVTAGVVRPDDGARRFTFRHPVVRSALYEASGPAWRSAAHGRVARALVARGEPPAAVAHHVARSARPGDLEAAEVLVEAANDVAAHAPASAAAWLEVASTIVPCRADTTVMRLSVLSSGARVHCLLGQLDVGHRELTAALELVPRDEPGRLELVAACAGVEHGLGRFPEARARLLAALAEQPSAGGAEAALCIELAVSFLYTLEIDDAFAFAERAMRSAEGVDAVLEATARALLAFVHASAETPGQLGAARAQRRAADSMLGALGDDAVSRRLDALYYLGWTERLLERYDSADAHLSRAVRVATARGGSQWLVPTMVERAKVLAWRGRLGEARALAETAVSMARISGIDLVLLLALSAECAVLVASGELAPARAAGTEALALCGSSAGYHAAIVRRQLALADLDAGDVVGFLVELDELESDGAASHGHPPGEAPAGGGAVGDGIACQLLEACVRAELACGRIDAASAHLARADELASASGLVASAGYAERARARLLTASRPEEAQRACRDAARRFDRAGAHLEASRTRLLLAELLAASGSDDEAILECRAACEALVATGAPGTARQAQLLLRRLRRTGAPSARMGRSASGAGGLSKREREIAELIADGRTNREIAAALVLSEKTVESHVSHVLAKLEVHGRGAVARALTRKEAPTVADA